MAEGPGEAREPVCNTGPVLSRLGRGCARFPKTVVVVWILAVAASILLGRAAGGEPTNGLTLPGASSQEALDLLEEDFPEAAGASVYVVAHTASGTTVTDPDVERALVSLYMDIEGLDHVAQVLPYATPDAISQNQRTAVGVVLYDEPQSDLPDNGTTAFDDLQDATEAAEVDGLDIELGGTLAAGQPIATEEIYTLYGLLLALLVLLVVLGTWWSFAWPVVGALIGIVAGSGLLRVLQAFVDVPGISATAGIMVGLGVGIDYGLFVTGRYKDFVAEGAEHHEAAGRALDTAGRAVLTAGATVIVALAALFVFQVSAVTAMAYAIVIFVVSVILTAVTLVPALLALVGDRIVRAPSRIRLRVPDDERTRAGIRWARFVSRHAALCLLAGAALLVVLALPVLTGGLRLGPLDTSLYPEDSTQYRAWELQTRAFGAGSTNPFVLVIQVPSSDEDADDQITSLQQAVSAADGVAFVTDPRANDDGSIEVMQVIPTTDAQAAATSELVDRLRDDVIPPAIDGTRLTVDVSGVNAVFVDLDQRILDRLPVFVGLVVLIALLILGAVFRSVLLPVKAAVFDLLVIGAVYGVTIHVFTNGFGLSLLGVPAEVPILSLLAPVFFAILFGLSNDYEVYLVTRMREELDDGEELDEAVVLGHGRGSHIVIAAALIMIFVFASYILQPGTSVVQFGFAMSVAILLDAAVARMVMLPAAVKLGGRAMWWPGSTTPAAGDDP